jgi:hypothetical protein
LAASQARALARKSSFIGVPLVDLCCCAQPETG